MNDSKANRPAVHDPTGRYRQPEWKAANGRRPCRWCHGEVPKGSRTFCGEQCVDAFLSTKGYQHLVPKVKQRDNEICQLCGMDCKAAREFAQRLRRRDFEAWRHYHDALGLPTSRRLWEADHIEPRCRGGANTLENLRTLCLPCHKAVTKRLAADRARERRDAKRTLLGMEPPHDTPEI